MSSVLNHHCCPKEHEKRELVSIVRIVNRIGGSEGMMASIVSPIGQELAAAVDASMGLQEEVRSFMLQVVSIIQRYVRVDMDLQASKVVGTRAGNTTERELSELEQALEDVNQRCQEGMPCEGLEDKPLAAFLARVASTAVELRGKMHTDALEILQGAAAAAESLVQQARLRNNVSNPVRSCKEDCQSALIQQPCISA